MKAQIRDWGRFDRNALVEKLHSTADLARDLDLWVVVGCSHRLTPPHRPDNNLYVISDRGEVTTRYGKRFLSHTEVAGWHTPGREPCGFEVEAGGSAVSSVSRSISRKCSKSAMHKIALLDEEFGDAAIDLMRRLKTAWDSLNIVNPGKLITTT